MHKYKYNHCGLMCGSGVGRAHSGAGVRVSDPRAAADPRLGPRGAEPRGRDTGRPRPMEGGWSDVGEDGGSVVAEAGTGGELQQSPPVTTASHTTHGDQGVTHCR